MNNSNGSTADFPLQKLTLDPFALGKNVKDLWCAFFDTISVVESEMKFIKVTLNVVVGYAMMNSS